ncbi:MAG TPA: hypothetical protein VMX94_09625 [Armatimonadota bacterium]|nr:hypothetical protein [Armatimonadota bacterium]
MRTSTRRAEKDWPELDGPSKPDYMSAWVNQQNILWGTMSALFVFLGLVLNVLASESLALVASAITSLFAIGGLLLFLMLTWKLRLNIAALEFYLKAEERECEWPWPPSDAELTRYSIRLREKGRFSGGWFAGRWAVGSPTSQKGLAIFVQFAILFFAVLFACCLYTGFASGGWMQPPPWIVAK